MHNKKWIKSFKVSASCLILAFIFVLSGCSKKEPITIKQAMENCEKIKSGYYVSNIIMNAAASTGEIQMNAKISVEGAFDFESDEKGKFEVNVNYQMVDLGMNFYVPIIIDIKNADDADVFVTIPTMISQLIGFPEGKNILYINTKEVVDEDEQAENEEITESFTKSGESVRAIFDNFSEKNKDILVFEEIEDKSIEANGKYLLNLNKEQSLQFIEELFEDKQFVSALEQLMNISASANPLGQGESTDIEEFKKEFIAELKNAEKYDLNIEIVIIDEFITEVKFNNSVTAEGQTSETAFDFKIEKINKGVEIDIPDKNTESVFDFSELNNILYKSNSSNEVSKENVDSSTVYYWIQDRYKYYDNTLNNGNYSGERYTDKVFQEAAKHFNLTRQEVKEKYDEFRY